MKSGPTLDISRPDNHPAVVNALRLFRSLLLFTAVVGDSGPAQDPSSAM